MAHRAHSARNSGLSEREAEVVAGRIIRALGGVAWMDAMIAEAEAAPVAVSSFEFQVSSDTGRRCARPLVRERRLRSQAGGVL